MVSPLSKREALLSTRATKSARLLHSPISSLNVEQHPEKRVSRRNRTSSHMHPRGLAMAKSASRSRRNLSEVVVEDMEEDDKPRRRLPRRTASNDERPASRRPLQRNKSCDGTTTPHQRVQRRNVTSSVVSERSTSVRRMERSTSVRRISPRRMEHGRSKRHLLGDRSKSERYLIAENSSRRPMDSSVDRSSRRRTLARTNSMDRSAPMNTSARRGGRKHWAVRENSFKNIPDFDMDDNKVAGEACNSGGRVNVRRRNTAGLSKLSITELRTRLVVPEEEVAINDTPGFFEVDWDDSLPALDPHWKMDDEQ